MIGRSLAQGWSLVWQFRSSILWIYLAMLVISVPLAAAMRDVLRGAIGSSLVHACLREGFDMSWYGEFSASSSGFAASFSPNVTGFLPVAVNGESFLDGEILSRDWTLMAPGLAFLAAMAFLSGGILSRYVRPAEGPTRSRFFADSAEYFPSLIRLLLLSLLSYWLVFRWVAEPLHERVEEVLRDVTVETTAIAYTLGVYLLVALILAALSLVYDYTRIALVARRRRSVLISMIEAVRFVLARPAKALGLYLVLSLCFLGMVTVYLAIAPGSTQSGFWSVLVAFLVGQAFILARVAVKLWFWASQSALYRSVHASAGGEARAS